MKNAIIHNKNDKNNNNNNIHNIILYFIIILAYIIICLKNVSKDTVHIIFLNPAYIMFESDWFFLIL